MIRATRAARSVRRLIKRKRLQATLVPSRGNKRQGRLIDVEKPFSKYVYIYIYIYIYTHLRVWITEGRGEEKKNTVYGSSWSSIPAIPASGYNRVQFRFVSPPPPPPPVDYNFILRNFHRSIRSRRSL